MKAHQLINQTSGDTEYYTDPRFLEAAHNLMGGIDLDPASSKAANKFVQADHYFDKDDDGLSKHWYGRVWLNHPFGRGQNKLWIEKLMSEFNCRNTDMFCCITYACTSEAWFQPLLNFPQCFLCPRTNYYLPDGTLKKGVTKGSVITFGGISITEVKKYFSKFGKIK